MQVGGLNVAGEWDEDDDLDFMYNDEYIESTRIGCFPPLRFWPATRRPLASLVAWAAAACR